MKNRIVMTPMGAYFGEQNGEMSYCNVATVLKMIDRINDYPDNLEGKKLRKALSFKAFRSFMYIPM